MNRYEIDQDSGLLVPRQREIIKPRHCSMAAPQQALASYGSSALSSDPYFANVVLLAHFNGSNGATTTTDSSNAAHTINRHTPVQIDTSQSKFGGSSTTCAGFGWDCSNSADWNLAGGQFTIEFWQYFTSSPGTGSHAMIARWDFGAADWRFGFNSSNQLSFKSSIGNCVGTYAPSLNTWIHFAVDRDASNVFRVYADGSVIASATLTGSISNSGQPMYFAGDIFDSAVTGYMDDLRITKGVARYAGAFTRPSAEFPNS